MTDSTKDVSTDLVKRLNDNAAECRRAFKILPAKIAPDNFDKLAVTLDEAAARISELEAALRPFADRSWRS